MFDAMHVLVVGCGYVGLSLGARLASEGHEVTGIRRSPDSDTKLRKAGIRPRILDITRENAFSDLAPDYEWIVNCVSSSRGDAEDYRSTYLQGTQRMIKWLKNSPVQKLLYTSSTSVYGQTDGSIVTEASPTEPAVETARILVETEKILLKAFRQVQFPAIILRLAGIYGPN